MKVISRYEHQVLRIGEDGFKRAHHDALIKLNEFHGGKYFEVIHKAVRFKQYVGVIQVDNLLIEIHPKADKHDADEQWRNVLLDMLKRCGRLKASSAGAANVNRKNLNLLEVYFELYLSEVDKLIRQGLIKQYRRETKNVNALKGKLEFAGHIRHNLVHKERFYTTHQVYDKDHLIHQVLSLALDVVEQFTKGTRLSGKCGQVQFSFPEVKKIKASADLFDRIPKNRKTAPYSYALELARLIILNYSPDISGGKEKMLSLLFDMNQLWEEFVLKELRNYISEHKSSYEVLGQDSKNFIGSHTLRPDIVLRNEKGEQIIIDTKWKVPYNRSASVADLRQMYAYGRYWDAEKVMLLYPGEKGQSTNFSEYDTDDYSLKGDEVNEQNHLCRLGYVSVLNDGVLSNNLGKDVFDLLEIN